MKTLLILLMTAGSWGYAAAQDTPSLPQSMPAKEQGDTSVPDFIMKAMKSSEKAIEAGQLAQGKAQSAAVKAYAERMVKDYTEATAVLKPIAAKKNITLAPTESEGVPEIGTNQPVAAGIEQSTPRIGTSVEKSPVPAATTGTNTTGSPTTKAWAEAKKKGDHKSMLDFLGQKSGAEFDREYMRMMVQDHADALSLFESAATSRDADIKNFATNILPVIKDHLQSAKTILSSLK